MRSLIIPAYDLLYYHCTYFMFTPTVQNHLIKMEAEDKRIQANPHPEPSLHFIALSGLGNIQSHKNPFMHTQHRRPPTIASAPVAPIRIPAYVEPGPGTSTPPLLRTAPTKPSVSKPEFFRPHPVLSACSFRAPKPRPPPAPFLSSALLREQTKSTSPDEAKESQRPNDPAVLMETELVHDLMRLTVVSANTPADIAIHTVDLPLWESASGKTLLLDLDDTLIRKTDSDKIFRGGTSDRAMEIRYDDETTDQTFTARIILRPYARRLLKEMSMLYEIIVIPLSA